MKRLVLVAAGGAALMLSACADDYYGPRHLHGDRYGEPRYSSPRYAAFYDDYYGPVYDGRWDNDGMYYYRSRADGPYFRDEGRHFRRDEYSGFHGVTFGARADIGVRVGDGGIGVRP